MSVGSHRESKEPIAYSPSKKDWTHVSTIKSSTIAGAGEHISTAAYTMWGLSPAWKVSCRAETEGGDVIIPAQGKIRFSGVD